MIVLFQIRKAYRKRALECHPDKNPDNPAAAEEFDRLKKILEILLDVGRTSSLLSKNITKLLDFFAIDYSV